MLILTAADMPKPSLWEVTTTFSDKAMPVIPPSHICKPAPGSKESQDFKAALAGADSKDCTITKSPPAPDGFVAYEADCTLGGGKDATKTHASLTGSAGDYRMTTRTQVSADLPTMTMEIHTVRVGDCPAGVKPGQVVTASGKVADPMAPLYGRPPAKPAPAPALEAVAEAAPAQSGKLAFHCANGLIGRHGVLTLAEAEPADAFGTAVQPWRVRPEIIVDPASGERNVVLWVDTPNKDDLSVLMGYDAEPRYTLRLGADFTLTPPIAQQTFVMAHAMDPDADSRTEAGHSAETAHRTHCVLPMCILGAADTAAFLKAYDKVAAAGGEMTISAPGPTGPRSIRYPLKDLGDLQARTKACPAARSATGAA